MQKIIDAINAELHKTGLSQNALAGVDGFFVDSHVVGSGFGDINRPYDVTDPSAPKSRPHRNVGLSTFREFQTLKQKSPMAGGRP